MDDLIIEDVTKKYGNFTVLNNVSLKVRKGEIMALVGPNGAGKSTLIKTSLGLLRRDSGKVLLFNKDPFYESSARERVGVIFERPSLPMSMPIEEFLSHVTKIYNKNSEIIKEAIDLVGLSNYENKPFSQLSAGQRQRAAIAHALISDPDMIIADEPTSNLDPLERNKILELFLKINKQKGLTIMISSHVLPEVLRVSTSIAIMKSGKVIKTGTPDDIIKNISIARIRCKDVRIIKENLEKNGYSLSIEGGNIYVKTENQEGISKLLNLLSDQIKNGQQIYGIELIEPVIEEILEG
ncbi:ABC-type multidrug transport system, ATPase component [Caldisphaera lagunensis DSM 15908]|uniref:ABC-type multidrug transport system, ATPase component n=1 Tax=Caldisphaera lagunensis (strain DSM 15908 / JCM 11604 / ANMR 0165 / IC-154) TaxID=1056495 RepID=L0AC61_CALLD|nr:ABC transporter ATP-binding protein [Caldisphaera lagunensis]AFZ70717.1 ABC-type multidrug transport system, ATPase component [Caldisphaera lagunensis DSM 15908]